MSSPFGIIGLLFSKNLPLLLGVMALDYLGMYFLNLGDIIESLLFFLMILLALLFSNRVHSGTTLLQVLVILFSFDMLLRWGLEWALPKEITTLDTEQIVQTIQQ